MVSIFRNLLRASACLWAQATRMSLTLKEKLHFCHTIFWWRWLDTIPWSKARDELDISQPHDYMSHSKLHTQLPKLGHCKAPCKTEKTGTHEGGEGPRGIGWFTKAVHSHLFVLSQWNSIIFMLSHCLCWLSSSGSITHHRGEPCLRKGETCSMDIFFQFTETATKVRTTD
jgi:hypothetical protein